MITALMFCLWLFGVCAILYGSTLLYWAWHSPEDADAAKWFIVAGMVMLWCAIWIMTKI